MDYTVITLLILGLFGILIHNLVKLNELNRANDGILNYRKYFGIEKFSIMLSLCVVVIALIVRTEITQLEKIGKWLGLAFVTLGYMAQSLIVAFMGKAQKFIDNQNKD